MNSQSDLIGTLREGVEIIKIVFYKRLKDHLISQQEDLDPGFAVRLSGAVVNQVFGTPNPHEPHRSFAEAHADQIRQVVFRIATDLDEMRIPLTDALRIQFLCDQQEGIDSTEILTQAQEAGILLTEREVPMPAAFMNLVRRLGVAFGILENPPKPPQDTEKRP